MFSWDEGPILFLKVFTFYSIENKVMMKLPVCMCVNKNMDAVTKWE